MPGMGGDEVFQHGSQDRDMMMIAAPLSIGDVVEDVPLDTEVPFGITTEIVTEFGRDNGWNMFVFRDGFDLAAVQAAQCNAIRICEHDSLPSP